MIIKTSWSTEHLQSLTQIKNHKILFDGYEYYWVRKLEDKWERHFILNFTNKKKAFHYLKYNIRKWQEELKVRLKITNKALCYKDLERMLDIQEKTIVVYSKGTLTDKNVKINKFLKELFIV